MLLITRQHRHEDTGRNRGTPSWRLIGPLLLTCVLAACVREPVAVQSVYETSAPTWTYRKPESGSIYYGLARVPLQANTEATRSLAIQTATSDMVLEIQRETRKWLMEQSQLTDASLFDAYWREVQWDRIEEIIVQQGAQRWYEELDRQRVWLLLSVDRDVIRRHLDSRRAVALPQAQSQFYRARQAHGRSDLLAELEFLCRAAAEVAGPEGLMVPGSNGPGSLLRAEIESQLKVALRSVTATIKEAPAALRPGDAGVPLVVETRAGSSPIALPMMFSFTEGEGDLAETVETSNNGQSTAQVLRVEPLQQSVSIRATPNLGRLGGGSVVEAQMVNDLVAQWALPQVVFTLPVTPSKMMLTYIERGGTGGERGSMLIQELGEAFRVWGAEPSEGKVEALLDSTFYDQMLAGQTQMALGQIPDTDLIGVVLVELSRIEKQGKAPEVFVATGQGVFKLYDVRRQRFRLEVSTGILTLSGFSRVDAERGFFLETMDRLRDLVSESLTSKTPSR